MTLSCPPADTDTDVGRKARSHWRSYLLGEISSNKSFFMKGDVTETDLQPLFVC